MVDLEKDTRRCWLWSSRWSCRTIRASMASSTDANCISAIFLSFLWRQGKWHHQPQHREARGHMTNSHPPDQRFRWKKVLFSFWWEKQPASVFLMASRRCRLKVTGQQLVPVTDLTRAQDCPGSLLIYCKRLVSLSFLLSAFRSAT